MIYQCPKCGLSKSKGVMNSVLPQCECDWGAPAAPVQEPVAWRVKVETKLRDGSVDVGYQLRNEKLSAYDEPLYTTPPAAQRQWVGLTDEEFEDIELGCRSTSSGKIEAMQKVEAKLRSKNNG